MFRNLRGNKSTTSPCSVFTLYTSTIASDFNEDGGTHLEKLRVGSITYCRVENCRSTRERYCLFTDTDTLWNFIANNCRKRETNYIFSHDMAHDLSLIGWPEEIDAGRLSLSITRQRPVKGKENEFRTSTQRGLLVLNGPPVIVDSWFRGGARVRLVDTLNYWPVPFPDLCRYASSTPLPLPDPWSSNPEFWNYVEHNNDCLHKAVIKLIKWHEENDLGVFKCTASGIGMQAFKHRFMQSKIVLHDVAEVRKLERSAYYAGRVATFYLGHVRKTGYGIDGYLFDKFTPSCPRPTGPIYKLDVNSLFPAVMKHCRVPRKLMRYALKDSQTRKLSPVLSADFIADVLIESNDCEYPVRVNGRTVYAVGRYRTALCGVELLRAVKSNHVKEVYDWAEYETDFLFSNFVDYFWHMRRRYIEANDILSAGLCKLIMNSMYGKFGQYSNEWVTDADATLIEPWHRWYMIDGAAREISEYRSISKTVQVRCRSDTHPESFPAVSAFITSYARDRMDCFREIAGYHNCMYQGVDSLHVNSIGFDRLKRKDLVQQSALGLLRLEETADNADYFGINYYRIGNRRVIGGVKEDATGLDEYTYRQNNAEKLESSVSHRPIGGYMVKRSVRRFMPKEPATGVTASGWVYPLRINECGQSLSNPATCSVAMRPAISTWLGSGRGGVSR